MYKKTMREALIEARAYRDPIDEGITGNIQKAITIAKKMSGNMTAAVKEIEKIAKGLSDDPSVRAALKTANESLDEAKDLMLTYGKPGGDAAKMPAWQLNHHQYKDELCVLINSSDFSD